MGLGASPEESLSRMSERYPGFSDFRRFLEAFKVTRRTGADLTHLLQTILVEMEGRSRIQRKMEAMTAQARLSGLLMGLLPFFLGVVFFVLDPSLMLPLFTERSGWALLSLAGVFETLGFLWIRQLLRVEI
jgi:tight adherence protein B